MQKSLGSIGWLLAASVVALCQPAFGQDEPHSTLGGELRRFLHDEASALLHIRSYFIDRVHERPPSLVALTGGGWVGLQTGWFYDTVQLGAVGYTSQPLWAPQNQWETSNGITMLRPGGYGFFALGQAYASARWQGQTFTGYRQYIDELEVNPWDNRMLPQTFEAYALRGQVADVKYFAGYVAAVKPRDYSVFINMGEAAGAPNVNAGMALASLKYGDPSRDGLALRASAYIVPNILWSSYYDATGLIPISEDFKVRLSGQFMVQGSNGANLLTGHPFGTFVAGGKVDAIWGPFVLTGAVMQTGSAADYRAPYGIFIGFNKQQVLDFDRAGERTFQIGAAYDFKAVGIPGMTFFANGVYGADAVNVVTGARLSQTWEYDLDLKFHAQALPVPDWLKPLQLRGRVAFIDQYLGNSVNSFTEYRVILNYEVTWNGPRRYRGGPSGT
jgi:hypothetical protein